MNIEQLITLINENLGTLIFAILGAFFLTVRSFKEHLDRDPIDKMARGQCSLYLLGWVIGYPLLGFIIALAYLGHDNQFGAWLALQIGLTSPAIALGLANGGANMLAKDGIPVTQEQ